MNDIIIACIGLTSFTAAITLLGMTLGQKYADKQWSERLTKYFAEEK